MPGQIFVVLIALICASCLAVPIVDRATTEEDQLSSRHFAFSNGFVYGDARPYGYYHKRPYPDYAFGGKPFDFARPYGYGRPYDYY